MYDFVILHASFGHPFEHWYSWLFYELRKKGKNVLVPQMPCSIEEKAPEGIEMQNYNSWSKVLDSYRPFLNDNTSYIAHSISPAFITSYLANNRIRAKNLFLIAPVYGEINAPDYNYVNKTFFECKHLDRVSDMSNKRFCYISRTDPYVPNTMSEKFASIINAENVYFDDAGHFNTAAGFTMFKELLCDIITNE